MKLLGKAIKERTQHNPQDETRTIHEEAWAGLEAAQLYGVPRPVTTDGSLLNPRLPPDLTVLNDIMLAKLFSEFACMAQYAKLHLARMAVMAAEAKRNEKLVRAKIRLEKSGQVGDRDAKTEIDPKTVEASFNTHVASGTFDLSEAVMEGYLIGRDACSREQTRRQNIFEKSNR